MLDCPGAIGTSAQGIDGNTIVGTEGNSDGNGHGFVYDGTIWRTLDYPGGAGTYLKGISGNNIVGVFRGGSNVRRSFLLTIPEPATLLLLALGGSGVLRRRRRS